MSGEQIQLIVDTDVGGDDLFCLSVLLSQPDKVRIHLVSCVRGLRTDGKEAVLRIRRLIKHFDYPYPVEVVAGDFGKKRHCFTEMDFVYRLHDEFFHGGNEKYEKPWEERLGFPELEEAEKVVKENNAVERILDLVSKKDNGHFSMLCIGPLVNISSLLEKDENIFGKIDKFVVMGGGIEKSNTHFESKLAKKTPATEWNWYCSPISVKNILERIKKEPCRSQAGKYFISTIEGSFSFPLVEGEFLFPCAEKAKDEIFSIEDRTKLNASKLKHFDVLKDLIYWNPISSLYDSVTAANLLNPKIINTKRMTIDIHVEEGKEGMAIMKDYVKKSSEEAEGEEDEEICVCCVGYSFSEDEYIRTLKNIFLKP